MSDYIESLFQGVDMLIDKRLENLNYDTTIICTITDNSDSKNGKYRVTDGSIAFTAYSDVSTYRSGEQVRVNVPQGDMTKKKFIIGKYLSDDNNSALTYVSPLNSVINITGNLFNLPEPIPGYWRILANGSNTAIKLWEDDLNIKQYGDLQANGIYNTLIIKAEFKTDLYNYNYINGTYGLRVELDVRPTPDSTAKYTKVVELSSKEMFGNPYNFTIFAPQAKVFNVVSAGVIEKIKLYLYQNNDFVNDREERIVPMTGTPENIFVKNIEIGLGSNVLDVEDNTVRIYSKESTNYSPEDNIRSLNLVWYNKDENNQSIGFEDQQIHDSSYNEFEYLQLVNLDQRLLNQQGKEKVNNDKTSLTLAANAEQIKGILETVARKISQDLNSEFNKIIDYSLPDEIIQMLQDKQDILTDLAADLNSLNTKQQEQYKEILSFIYDLQRYNQNPEDFDDKPSFDKGVIDFYERSFFSLNISEKEYKDYSIKTLHDGYLIKITNDIIIPEGYTEIFNIFNYQISKILESIKKLLDEIPDDCDLIESFLAIIQANDQQILAAYQQTDLSLYDNQYDIYWYRYEEKYEAPDTEYKLMPNGWKRYDTQDKITLADKCFISDIILDPMLEQEKFIALVIYNHEIYKSNELVFNNTNPLPAQKETDATDTLRIEHIASTHSFNTYYVYDATNNLKDALDAGRDREMRCHYDGLRYKDDILIGATIHWYVPTNSTMLTYDKDFLQGKGFTCPEKQTKTGYIEFYKKIEKILKSTLREDQYDSWGEEGKGFTLVEGNDAYDDRSFWYKIKSQLDTGFTNNDIICRVVLATDTKEVETKEFFFFGLTGNTGTKYTFNIYNNNKKKAFVTNDTNTDSLKLSIELRDPAYKIIDFQNNPTVNWLGYKQINTASTTFELASPNVQGKDITLTEQSISGVIIGETQINYFLPDDGSVTNVEIESPVTLSCLYPVPYSISEDYVLDGPINIIYNNFGSLDSKLNYDAHYQLIDRNNNTPITNVKIGGYDCKIKWEITYGIINTTENADKTITVNKNFELISPEHNDYKNLGDFYEKYLPKLTLDRRLEPAPLYLSGLYMIPFVEAYIEMAGVKVIIYSQPIIIKQDKYPSEFLNEWNGGYYVEEKAGLIMSSMVGAGRKNIINNTFDGILMGEVKKQTGMTIMKDNLGEGTHSGLGLYGFHDGEQSFGFNIDGSAFIGKTGGGRIMFDGNKGFIASANWFAGKYNEETETYDKGGRITSSGIQYYEDSSDGIPYASTDGLCIDLQNGYLDAYNFKLTSDNIYLNSNPVTENYITDYFLKIGDESKGDYISFDSSGKLRLQVNEFYLTGNMGGVNLLRQTHYLPTNSQEIVWDSNFCDLQCNNDNNRIENNYLTLDPDTGWYKGYTVQEVPLELEKNYTISGYTRLHNYSSENSIILGVYYVADSGGFSWAPLEGKRIVNGEMDNVQNHCVLTNKTTEWEYFSYTFSVKNEESIQDKQLFFTAQLENSEIYNNKFSIKSSTRVSAKEDKDFFAHDLAAGGEIYADFENQRYNNILYQYKYDSITENEYYYIGNYYLFDRNQENYSQYPFCLEFIRTTTTVYYKLNRCIVSEELKQDSEYEYKISIRAPNNSVDFKYLKLEEGVYASSWSPALTDNITYLNGGMTQLEIFDKLFKDPTTNNYIQGVSLTNGKVYISAEVIQTGILKSANFVGNVDSETGEIRGPTESGTLLNLNTGTFTTPNFHIQQKKQGANTVLSGTIGGWSFGADGLSYYSIKPEQISFVQSPLFDDNTECNNDPNVVRSWTYDINLEQKTGYSSRMTMIDETVLSTYNNVLYYKGQCIRDKNIPSIVSILTSVSYNDDGEEETSVDVVYAYIDKDYPGYSEEGTLISEVTRKSDGATISLANVTSIAYIQAMSTIEDNGNPINKDDIEFDIYTISQNKPFYSYFGNAANKPFYSADKLLIIGANSEIDLFSSRFGVLNNGTIHLDAGPAGGRWAFANKEFLCYGSKDKNATAAWSLSGGLSSDHNGLYAQFLTIKISQRFQIIKSDPGTPLVKVADRQYNSIIQTQGEGECYSGLMHYRSTTHGYAKFGVGGQHTGTASLEHSPEAHGAYGPAPPDARLDVYPLVHTLNSVRYTVGLNVGDGQRTFTQLYFAPSYIRYAGTIITNHANIPSTEKIKNNITKVPKKQALDLFDSNSSQIYSYNLELPKKEFFGCKKDFKDEATTYGLKRNAPKYSSKVSYGFVIGDQYHTPAEVIGEDGESIDLYSMASLNWKATQELYELYKDLSSKIDDLQNINGEKGEINNEINK